jgi:hypothetical protein
LGFLAFRCHIPHYDDWDADIYESFSIKQEKLHAANSLGIAHDDNSTSVGTIFTVL